MVISSVSRLVSRARGPVLPAGARSVRGGDLTAAAGAAVDAEGTAWVWCEHRGAWRYLTWHGLSFEDHLAPPDRYGPYTPLDGPAADVLRGVARRIA